MKYYTDLHMHTQASDGTMTPEMLLQAVIDKGLAMFAITDHDAIGSLGEMKELVKGTDILFVPGVEISLNFKGRELHFLTYNVDPEDPLLQDILASNQQSREDFNKAFIEFAATRFPMVTYKDYEAFRQNRAEGGWKAEQYLRKKGVTKNFKELLALLTAANISQDFPTPQEVLPKLVKAGYQISLAHPPAYFRGALLEEDFLDELVSFGVSAIECDSPYFRSQEDKDYYKNYCRNKGLIMTNGSDFHGDFTPNRSLGEPLTPRSEEELLRLWSWAKGERV